MAGTINNIACDFVKGVLPAFSQRTRTWEIAGVDGVGSQQAGLRSPKFTITAVKFGGLDDVEAWQDSIVAIDEVVEITTDTNRQHPKCLVESAAASEVTAAVRHDGAVSGLEVMGSVVIRGRMLPGN